MTRATPATPTTAPDGATLSTLASLRRLLPYVRFMRTRLLLGMASALGASLCALAIPRVLEYLVNGTLQRDVGTGHVTGLVWAVAAVLALGVLEAVLIRVRRRFVLEPSTQLEARMRTDLFRHLQDLPVAFHDQWPGGQLLSRSMSDLGLLRRWVAFGVVQLVVASVTVVVGVGILLVTSGVLGLIYLVGSIPVTILAFRFSRRYRVYSRASQDQAGDLATAVEESVHGIRVLKAFGRGRDALRSFTTKAGVLRETELRKAATLSRVDAAFTAIPEVTMGAALVVGIALVVDGSLSVGAFVAFFATAAVVNSPVIDLGMVMSMTLNTRTAVDRYFDVMTTPNTVADPLEPRPLPLVAPGRVRGELVFDAVRFAYPDAPGSPVLDHVDLTVPAGVTMAVVGLTGGGKTTLAMLVPRLYDVTGGSVRIDGVDVRDLARRDLRSVVAVAFEDATLFSASVRENVLLGAPDDARDEEALRRALEVAQAGFVDDLPHGVETTIGEEGMSLSGGQRQRLALARAVAARPSVLVLDDPLSALDVDTEAAIQARLRETLAGITTLVVAHRPSTVALADLVAVLRDGRVSAVGTHHDLIASDPYYRYLISNLEEAGPGHEDTSSHDVTWTVAHARAQAIGEEVEP